MNVDTAKIRKCGNDIVKLSQELNEVISSLYSNLTLLSSNGGAWQGNKAQSFTVKSNEEKTEFIDLKNILYSLGNSLILSAEKYELEVKNK